MPELSLASAYWPAQTSTPLRETTIGSILRDAADRAPDKIALIDGTPDRGQRRRWTYRALLADAERTARALLRRFSPGMRIAVWSGNSPEWLILEFAAALAGLTLVTVNPAYRGDELAHVLGHSQADGLFMADEYQGADLHAILAAVRGRLPRLREVISFGNRDDFTQRAGERALLPSVDPSDVAQLLYTSGTTGRPKGALLTHRGLTNNARLAFAAAGVGSDDLLVNPMPLFHVGGGMFTLGAVSTAGTQVLMPRFSPALQLELIETYRATMLLGVPTMMNAMIGHPELAGRDLSSLRIAISGGAVSPPALVRQVEAALGVTYSISFAQTESSCSITMSGAADSADDRAETLGRPLPDTEVRIADLGPGETAGCGVVGEICTRGYLVMRGYLNDPDATATAIDADGWLHTGDLGSMDERGYLRIAGRIKDMIIRGGENIYPREIEEVLISHPAVADATVLGFPDDHYGETVAAAIRPARPDPRGTAADATDRGYDPGAAGANPADRDPADAELADKADADADLDEKADAGLADKADAELADELAAFCRARLAPYKVPVRWLITDAFPLTASGKVRKDALREQLAARTPA